MFLCLHSTNIAEFAKTLRMNCFSVTKDVSLYKFYLNYFENFLDSFRKLLSLKKFLMNCAVNKSLIRISLSK